MAVVYRHIRLDKNELAEWQEKNGAATKGRKLGPQTETRKLKASKSIKAT